MYGNTLFFDGYLTGDPQPVGSGLKISVANNSRYKDRQGNMQEKTVYMNCVAWKPYVVERKGQKVSVHGSLSQGEYTNRAGQTVKTTDIVIADIFVDPAGPQGGDQQYGHARQHDNGPQYNQAPPQQAQQQYVPPQQQAPQQQAPQYAPPQHAPQQAPGDQYGDTLPF